MATHFHSSPYDNTAQPHYMACLRGKRPYQSMINCGVISVFCKACELLREGWRMKRARGRGVDIFYVETITVNRSSACPPPALLHQHICICSITDFAIGLIKSKKQNKTILKPFKVSQQPLQMRAHAYIHAGCTKELCNDGILMQTE